MKKQMKMHLGRILVMLTMFLLLPQISGKALAEMASTSVSISAAVVLEGSGLTESRVHRIELVPGNEENPMPEDGTYILEIQGENTSTFAPIHYTRPGVYHYTLYPVLADDSEIAVTEKIYLTVTVVNVEGGLDSVVVVYQNSESSKLDLPVFYYRDTQLSTETEPETWESETGESETEESETTGNEAEEETEGSRQPGLVPTGVQDRWPLYTAGIILLLAVAGAMIRLLKNSGEEDEPPKY